MRNYPPNIRDVPHGVGAGRLLFPAIVLLLVAGSCAGYGMQVAQRYNAATAQFTFMLAGILALVALLMFAIGIISIRSGHRAAAAEWQAREEQKGSTWTRTRRQRGEYHR